MGTISKNFSYNEFERSDAAKRHHIVNAVTNAKVRDSIKVLVENILQPLRDALATPVSISSGYRCPEVNALVGGVPTSQHTKGEAADVCCDTLTPYDIAQRAYDLKLLYDQMIIYPTFVHFSHKKDGGQRGEILYNKSYRGRKVKI